MWQVGSPELAGHLTGPELVSYRTPELSLSSLILLFLFIIFSSPLLLLHLLAGPGGPWLRGVTKARELASRLQSGGVSSLWFLWCVGQVRLVVLSKL